MGSAYMVYVVLFIELKFTSCIQSSFSVNDGRTGRAGNYPDLGRFGRGEPGGPQGQPARVPRLAARGHARPGAVSLGYATGGNGKPCMQSKVNDDLKRETSSDVKGSFDNYKWEEWDPVLHTTQNNLILFGFAFSRIEYDA